jgi:hypothetical protein
MRKGFKILGVLAVVVVGIAVFAGIALAQGPDDGSVPPTGPVDQDGDGICDVCGQEIGDGLMRGWRFNQDGDATQFRQGPPADRPFVDENGDGICDNCGQQLGDGLMRGWRFNQDGDAAQLRQGPPADRPFVDADGDGVCDNYPTGLQAGRMGGRR